VTTKFERSNPIPPGRYWVDVVDDTLHRRGAYRGFQAWLKSNSKTVRVLKHESTVTPVSFDTLFDAARPQLDWYLFEVSAPTKRWAKSAKLGFPTVVSRAVKKRTDVHKAPPEKTVKEYWMGDDDGDGGLFPDLKNVSAALTALAVIWWLKN